MPKKKKSRGSSKAEEDENTRIAIVNGDKVRIVHRQGECDVPLSPLLLVGRSASRRSAARSARSRALSCDWVSGWARQWHLSQSSA